MISDEKERERAIVMSYFQKIVSAVNDDEDYPDFLKLTSLEMAYSHLLAFVAKSINPADPATAEEILLDAVQDKAQEMRNYEAERNNVQ